MGPLREDWGEGNSGFDFGRRTNKFLTNNGIITDICVLTLLMVVFIVSLRRRNGHSDSNF